MRARFPSVIAAVLVLPALAVAAEEGHHAGISSLVFPAINFGIFVWILARFAMPGVRVWVRERHHRVVRALNEAATAKAEAERLRLEWQEKVARLDETIAQLRKQARQDAERERDRILAAAVKTAEAIRRDAERTAAYEVRRAQQVLRAELVRAALSVAESGVRAQWTPQDQRRSIDEFLAQVKS